MDGFYMFSRNPQFPGRCEIFGLERASPSLNMKHKIIKQF